VSVRFAKQAGSFSETTIDDEVVLLNLDTGCFFSLTGSAAAIWPLIDGERNRHAMLTMLAARYNAAPEEIGADLDQFLGQLLDAGFIAHA